MESVSNTIGGRKLRVAILLLNAGRGSGEVARQHVRYLTTSGCQVYFMHPDIGEGAPGAINRDIPLHTDITPVHEYLPSAGEGQAPVSGMTYETAARYIGDYERALEAVVHDVDIILGHHANLSAIATAKVARRAGLPYVLFLHGTGIEPRHSEGYDDRIWARIQDAIEGAQGLLVTTEYVRDQLVRNMIDLPLERFLLLPCGIDLEEFRSGRDPEVAARYGLPETYVICPGALTEAKGPQNVVEATRQYADLAPTIFIGDGTLRRQLAADLGERGRFLGFVSAEDKAALINAAAVLTAAPEKKEHFGIIYAEALAAGTPPVAYKGGGVSSIITPETGILTPRSPAALGRAIRGLLTDEEGMLCAMAENGRRRAEAKFDWRALGQRLERWLSGLST